MTSSDMIFMPSFMDIGRLVAEMDGKGEVIIRFTFQELSAWYRNLMRSINLLLPDFHPVFPVITNET
jgi:hypothetical protein